MSLKEFASTVIDSNILTMKEISEMVKYYADVSISLYPLNKLQG